MHAAIDPFDEFCQGDFHATDDVCSSQCWLVLAAWLVFGAVVSLLLDRLQAISTGQFGRSERGTQARRQRTV
ncbi:hypothetical protein RBSWK_03616 [Rhodopirellula baltica SWK14]|uniref:Transmembrane protein n=1 Tax=Rhodopirellula baltica SWK14 TaxID=993516 RepID=L7CE47_RHOBT|nr:hypothetical protein RBSWK_03616 [Rhodopirellula baltica SWK14]